MVFEEFRGTNAYFREFVRSLFVGTETNPVESKYIQKTLEIHLLVTLNLISSEKQPSTKALNSHNQQVKATKINKPASDPFFTEIL